jgi:hypothetical protein
VNFTDPDGAYCGEPSSPADRRACLSKNGTFSGLEARYVKLGRDTAGWRLFY